MSAFSRSSLKNGQQVFIFLPLNVITFNLSFTKSELTVGGN